jgi:peptidoglycan hydrolase-like protein with peptidoglycan-binding domain
MFKYMQPGDMLPMVSILQLLLNRQREGSKITVDGAFGPLTKQAVLDFQKLRRLKSE